MWREEDTEGCGWGEAEEAVGRASQKKAAQEKLPTDGEDKEGDEGAAGARKKPAAAKGKASAATALKRPAAAPAAPEDTAAGAKKRSAAAGEVEEVRDRTKARKLEDCFDQLPQECQEAISDLKKKELATGTS